MLVVDYEYRCIACITLPYLSVCCWWVCVVREVRAGLRWMMFCRGEGWRGEVTCVYCRSDQLLTFRVGERLICTHQSTTPSLHDRNLPRSPDRVSEKGRSNRTFEGKVLYSASSIRFLTHKHDYAFPLDYTVLPNRNICTLSP